MFAGFVNPFVTMFNVKVLLMRLAALDRRSLTHPEVIHELDSLLKLHRDVHRDVVVEAGTHGEALRERRPVVFPA